LKNISDRQLAFFIKPPLFILCLLPFIFLIIAAVTDGLGTNPVETLTHETGQWGLRLLLITLLVTPLRRLTGQSWLIKLRRMLGLFAFFYALLHFITYIWLDQFFDWVEILVDIPKRPFITVGFISFVLLLPLALTSNKTIQRRLKKRWLTLHKLVYVIPILVLLHFTWSLKADYSEPFLYALIFLVLMMIRFLYSRKKAPQL
jgi:sulfoxide reductase heme-binding subunit YedZ